MPEECVVDTSCLIVLDKIGLMSLLCRLYEKVYIPRGVVAEFGMIPLIPCAEVVDVCSKLIAVLTEELNLGLGEAETIAYAYERDMRAVIDDARARKVAAKLGVKLTGTIGLLMKAQEKGLVESSSKTALDLRKVGFRISDGIIEELKKRRKES